MAGANILCEVSAHNGWITGMDLASQSGLLLTCAEDSYVRVWQLNTKGALVEHWFSHPVQDSLMAGAKFMDPRGSSFCISSYDSTQIKVSGEWSWCVLGLHPIALAGVCNVEKTSRDGVQLSQRRDEMGNCKLLSTTNVGTTLTLCLYIGLNYTLAESLCVVF